MQVSAEGLFLRLRWRRSPKDKPEVRKVFPPFMRIHCMKNAVGRGSTAAMASVVPEPLKMNFHWIELNSELNWTGGPVKFIMSELELQFSSEFSATQFRVLRRKYTWKNQEKLVKFQQKFPKNSVFLPEAPIGTIGEYFHSNSSKFWPKNQPKSLSFFQKYQVFFFVPIYLSCRAKVFSFGNGKKW